MSIQEVAGRTEADCFKIAVAKGISKYPRQVRRQRTDAGWIWVHRYFVGMRGAA
ncbi:hypothetical protein [Pseudomonas sp. LTJR-52]|uniref:hypothetical protein n=1 Tax=Pseudomonas sp. LTJR-52 TaxID=2479392 RepID=UPI0013CF2A3D|nr:hypothetical protein [Pseudomonas sp. LTJR-52]